ncbi:unnamed protein product [Ilex paraguariensis]|uniref:Uncharacterized protein n=1 Tax=Ilex paraguariensis TaxID=185542 RepID=A0ABC8U256_9AQUA
MTELCLMASHGHGYPPGLVFQPEQGMSKVSMDCQPLLPSLRSKQDITRLSSLNLRPHQSNELGKPMSGFSATSQFVRIDSTIRRPVLLDVQDSHTKSILFSFRIAEKCTKHDKILKYLMSRSSEAEIGGLDLSVLSDLMGLQALTNDMPQQPCAPDCRLCSHSAESQPSLLYPITKLNSQMPLVYSGGDLTYNSGITVHSDGQVSVTGAETEIKDIFSVVAEFYLSNDSTKWKKQSLLVPHFNRLDGREVRANIQGSSLKLETIKVAPLKSPERIKLKPSPKKKSIRKATKERDLYRKNPFHACESLLSIMVDKKRHGKTAILSLKKSGPELPQLLTQFSASIAGTGLAVLFSVVCKVGCSRVPFCASKLLNTGLGLGLVWLSWAVNRLRDTVVHICKNSGKLDSKEEELMKNLDKSVNEIYLRAATLMTIAVLRFV